MARHEHSFRIPHFAFLIALLFAFAARAHDIPNDVRVVAFVKAEAQQLHVAVRVPMNAMREVDFPTHGGGYLDLARVEPALRNAVQLWLVNNLDVYEGDVRLPRPAITTVRVSLPSDRSFQSYESALAHLDGPKLRDDLELYWSHGYLDVLLDYPIRSARSDFAVEPRFARLGLQVAIGLKFISADDAMRVFDLHGDPGFVRLDPRWHQAFARFVELGFMHILDGTDHLLFLFCLILPFRNLRSLVVIATAFTVGHSITLIAAARGLAPDALWFPPLVETLIAATILYTALENIVGCKLQRRWIAAGLFGLIHGLGFAFGLRDSLQLAGEHLVTSLLAFNLGIEFGQLAVLAIAVPPLAWMMKRVPNERLAIVIASAFIAHTAWHWMLERYDVFRKFRLPEPDPAALAQLVRWLILGLTVSALVWLLAGPVRNRIRARAARK